MENSPLASSFAPSGQSAGLGRPDHLCHGAEFLCAADGEHHEDSLAVALIPNFVDALVTAPNAGDGAVGETVSHVFKLLDLHADEPGLYNIE